MNVEGLRSPCEKVGGIVHFGRMLDKIRLQAKGALPAGYQENLGKGFDEIVVKFLGVEYADLVRRIQQGATDEEILDWSFTNGRKPARDEMDMFNDFLRKRGWNDGLSERLKMRKKEIGAENRDDIQTFFDFIDADEGRK